MLSDKELLLKVCLLEVPCEQCLMLSCCETVHARRELARETEKKRRLENGTL